MCGSELSGVVSIGGRGPQWLERPEADVLDRYSTPQMRAIWAPQATLDRWREVELAVLDARVALGEAPAEVVRVARGVPAPTVAQVHTAEARTRHDVVAFLDVWCSDMPDAVNRWVHRGLTSSDVVDTALALQLCSATDLLLQHADELVRALAKHALAHRTTARVGRTHGMHAAPDTWGHRVADLTLATDRARNRLKLVRSEIAVAKISGPVGNYAHVSPEVERLAADALGLRPVEVASQVVMRDRLSEWICALALIASVCECLALEIRHGQRSEVNELAEGFTAGQTGSSAMPHKRNPISAEKLCGLARVVRSYVVPVMEGIALWHDRDISHSSVERICIPDAAMLVEHVLTVSASLITDLYVNHRQMAQTLADAGTVIFSDSAVAMLTAAGMRREDAHALVQRAADDNTPELDFADRVRREAAEAQVHLDEAVWSGLFSNTAQTSQLDHVFERVAALLTV